MNIAVIGATGMVGSRLVAEAVTRGHQVVAASRRPQQTPAPGIIPTAVDLADEQHGAAALDAALAKSDAVLLTVRPAAGQEDSIAPSTSAVLDAAAKAGIRVLVVGGAGPLKSPRRPGLLVIDDPDHVPAQWRAIAGASTAQLRTCKEHPYGNWTYLSPPSLLEPGTRTGTYRRGTTTLLTAPDGTSRISVEDLAVAALDELEHPEGERHFTVAAAVADGGSRTTSA
ncbi:NAD(P)-dependent oxidoreductase [Streptomyces boluensis]|uniref:NAD(P)H-binding protein n=1 Tax=Streptomyces boluensis TaxID=1775135 RepID=A0A964XMT0_9ACTN|nr:NAD(P)H-binding protein [Streptomyces boluensis]NBE53496.1 NAD(P)H-binding protein [Streptomyces boluensis]